MKDIREYQSLGVRKAKNLGEFDDYDNLPIEILFIITDETAKYFEKRRLKDEVETES